jgi:hypothetical protein
MIGTKPYAKLKYREVKGRQMAYIDEGRGRRDRVSARSTGVVVLLAQRHSSPGRKVPADRLRPHWDGQVREAQPLGTGSLSLLRTSRRLTAFQVLACKIMPERRLRFATISSASLVIRFH